jgi:ATP-dependent RNA helicase DeaD
VTDSAPGPDVTPFADLGLCPELLQALVRLGYEEPTPVQREAIGPLLEGRDVLGQAETGTGKTAAFALPMLQSIGAARAEREPLGLVLVPTRELALQVAEAFERYGAELRTRVLAVYGGQPIVPQIKALQRGMDVVVATPGRARDHIARGSLTLDGLRVVVLDEADEMLDMGFAEDIEDILGHAPAGRQTVLFSATMPGRINHMARRHLNDHVLVRPAREATPAGEAPRVRQVAYIVARHHRATALARVLGMEDPAAAIVFCRTRAEVDDITEQLAARGHRAEALHGGLSQEQRSRVIERMRAGSLTLLVATDVAARGLDIEQLTHVINLDVPSSPEVYVHRTGRVGRAGRDGVAITLAHPREQRMIGAIERLVGRKIPVAPIPSTADLRARRAERLAQKVAETMETGGHAAMRALAERMSSEVDPLDLAAAALTLAQAATWPRAAEDEVEIPAVPEPRHREPRPRGPRPNERRSGPHAERPRRGPSGPTERVFIGAGRAAGVRPQDLVGAITGESSLSGREIGAIQIHDRFALVEVPAPAVNEVVRALRGTTIKGRKASVRPEDTSTRRG